MHRGKHVTPAVATRNYKRLHLKESSVPMVCNTCGEKLKVYKERNLKNLFAECHNLRFSLIEDFFSQRLIPFARHVGSMELFFQLAHFTLMTRFHGCHLGICKCCLKDVNSSLENVKNNCPFVRKFETTNENHK